ncbi:hypothetical protein IWW38_001525, partial [Coemansia aciculifera]
SSAAFAKIDTLLSDASSSLHTERFAPHVTLFSPVIAASDEEAIAQVHKYAETLASNSISVVVTELAAGSKYYQCIILKAMSSDTLECANKAARQYWSMQNQPCFNPHVSIVYGDLADEQLSKALSLVRNKLPVDLQELSFVATEIRVANTEGPCDQWRTIGNVPIG